MADRVRFVQDTLNAIWNQKMVGSIYATFASGVRVHRSCQDDLFGQEALVVDTIERLAAFPDLRLTIDDIIWQGSQEQGYRVSISMNFAGHNLGVSRYGAATQREIDQSVLLSGRIANGRFEELWIAEDERSLVEQLEYDLLAAMRSIEAMEAFLGQPAAQDMPAAMGEIQRLDRGRSSMDSLAAPQLDSPEAVRVVLSSLWNERQIGLCERFYSDDFACHWASNRQLEGREAYQAVVLAHLATFPDLTFHIDDIIEQQRDDGWHVALNWTMLGTHAGPGAYGIPSGKRVQIAGISQYVIRDQRIAAERTEWNEFRLMQKIMERPIEPESDENTD
ncbi:MAG: ester cyclase [Anaerolineae bacterium]|nr:ester cyclase [Anaerolineae bacterium]